MATATLQGSSGLGLPPDTYIYTLARLQDCIAAVSSNSQVTFIDPNTLKPLLTKSHKDVTSLAIDQSTDQATCATAGRDGVVRLWDERRQEDGVALAGRQGHGFSSVAVSGTLIAAGNENQEERLGDCSVYVWDARKPSTPLREYPESHTDSITCLRFHDTRPGVLLSASTDALLTLFDTKQAEEDDAVLQVFNHSAAVHCASFLSEDEIAAVSTDEQLSIYEISKAEEVENEEVHARQTVYGDVRGELGCSYVVDLLRSSGSTETWIASGNLEEKTLKLTPMVRHANKESTKWTLDHARNLIFPGAHGEEVVRSVCLDPAGGRVFSCGEDGIVRAWSVPDSQDASAADVTEQMEVEKDEDAGGGDEEERRRKRKEKKKARREGRDRKKERHAPY